MFRKLSMFLGTIFVMALLSTPAFAQFNVNQWIGTRMEIIIDAEFSVTELDLDLLPATPNITQVQQVMDGYNLATEFETTSTQLLADMETIMSDADLLLELEQGLSSEDRTRVLIVKARAGYVKSQVGNINNELGSYLAVMGVLHVFLDNLGDFAQEVYATSSSIVNEYYQLKTQAINDINYFDTLVYPCGAFWWFYAYNGYGHDQINRMSDAQQAAITAYQEYTGRVAGSHLNETAIQLDALLNGDPFADLFYVYTDNGVTEILDQVEAQFGYCSLLHPECLNNF